MGWLVPGGDKVRIAFFIAALWFVSVTAFAEDKKLPTIDPAVCKQLTEYAPSVSANAEYKAGTTIDGKAVAPADISHSNIKVPRVIKFGIDVDVAQYAGIPVPAGQNLANIGTIELDTKTGDMDFNGQPVEGDALARIRYLCRTAPAATKQDAGGKNILHTPDNILNPDAGADADKHNQ